MALLADREGEADRFAEDRNGSSLHVAELREHSAGTMTHADEQSSTSRA